MDDFDFIPCSKIFLGCAVENWISDIEIFQNGNRKDKCTFKKYYCAKFFTYLHQDLIRRYFSFMRPMCLAMCCKFLISSCEETLGPCAVKKRGKAI